jgi:hypothetical protein
LWKSDGTGPGTVPVNPNLVSNPGELTDFQGSMHFVASSTRWGTELFKTEIEQ